MKHAAVVADCSRLISCHWCQGSVHVNTPMPLVDFAVRVVKGRKVRRLVYGCALLDGLICDLCSEEIPRTSPIIAITEWRSRQGEPDPWEAGVLTVVSMERWTHIADRVSKIRERLKELMFGKIHS